jgi:hypothetical protein
MLPALRAVVNVGFPQKSRHTGFPLGDPGEGKFNSRLVALTVRQRSMNFTPVGK